MKHLKKCFAIIILVCILFTVINATALTLVDVAGTPYENAVTVLEDLGILADYKDNTFLPEELMTRVEFARIIANLMNISDKELSVGEASAFRDVPADLEGAGAINALAEIGLISGRSGGMYDPFAYLNYEEAIKTILTVLGYDVLADKQGGFPYGYLIFASRNGFGGFSMGQRLTRGELARMLYHAIDIDMLSPVSYGNVTKYDAAKGKTILAEKFDIFKWEGLVEANENTGISADGLGLRKGEVQINNTIYDVGETNASKLLGYYVTYYFKDETDKNIPRIISVLVHRKNDELIITADNLVGFSDNTYSYYEEMGTSTYTASVKEDAKLIYNNRLFTNPDRFDSSMLTPDNGYVRLIDNDGDGIYDVLFVSDYDIIVVGAINREDRLVYDKYNSSMTCLLEDTSKRISIVNTAGKEIKFSDINQDDVISVLRSDDGYVVEAVVSRERVTGTIKESSKDSNGVNIYVVNAREYKVTKNNANIPEISVNSSRTFLLDFAGKIAGMSDELNIQPGVEVGYLIKAQSNASGLKNNMSFLIFTSSGEFASLEGTDKIMINGIKVSNSDIINCLQENKNFLLRNMYPNDDLNNNSKNWEGLDHYYDQLVSYKTNEDGLITAIDLPYFDDEHRGNRDANTMHVAFSLPSGTRHVYKNQQMTFNGFGNITQGSLIFVVPPTAEKRVENPDERGFVLSTVTKEFRNDAYYPATVGDAINVEGYKISSAQYEAEYVVYRSGASATVPNNQPVTIVDRVTSVINEFGEQVTKIYGYTNGEEITHNFEREDIYQNFLTANSKVGKLERGDLVRFSLNAKDDISAIALLYKVGTDFGDLAEYGVTAGTTLNALDSRLYGYVYSRKGNIMRMYLGDRGEGFNGTLLNVNLARYKVVVCDMNAEGGRVYTGTFDDLFDYKRFGIDDTAKVVVHSNWAEGRTIFVYR